MKKLIQQTLTALALILTFAASSAAQAATLRGDISYVGTMPELNSNGFHTRFRFRLENSTCSTDSTARTRWVLVNGGVQSTTYQHNATNVRNAYNTLMAAFLSGRKVEIHGASCTTADQTINLWNTYIGIY